MIDLIEEQLSLAERQARAEEDHATDLLNLALAGDPKAIAQWAEPRYVYTTGFDLKPIRHERPATIGDVLCDLTDYSDQQGDFSDALIEVFIRAARGLPVQADALELLSRMAAKDASLNVNVE